MEDVNWMALVKMLLIAALLVPGVLMRNRGNILRYAAIWLAAIVALAWAHQSFGPF